MKNTIIFLATLFAMFAPANAVTIESYKIIAEITDKDTVTENIIITLVNDQKNNINSATITLPKESTIISIHDTYDTLTYNISKTNKLAVNLKFTRPLVSGTKKTLTIETETKDLLTHKDNYFEYLLVFTPTHNISDFEHMLKLPKEAKLYSSEENSRIIFPKTALDENYETPTLLWHMDLKARQPEVFLVRFQVPYTDWLSIGTSIISTLIACIALWLLSTHILKKHKKSKILSSVKLLNENEKTIIEQIIKNPGITQKKLQEKLGYKKSAISKIITRLETRDIIERKKYGKINKLYLGKRMKK